MEKLVKNSTAFLIQKPDASVRLKMIHFRDLRKVAERYRFVHPRTMVERVSYTVPSGAIDKRKEPFFIRFLTKEGRIVEGIVTCGKVDTLKHRRRVRFVESGEWRWVRDIFIIQIDGFRIIMT